MAKYWQEKALEELESIEGLLCVDIAKQCAGILTSKCPFWSYRHLLEAKFSEELPLVEMMKKRMQDGVVDSEPMSESAKASNGAKPGACRSTMSE